MHDDLAQESERGLELVGRDLDAGAGGVPVDPRVVGGPDRLERVADLERALLRRPLLEHGPEEGEQPGRLLRQIPGSSPYHDANADDGKLVSLREQDAHAVLEPERLNRRRDERGLGTRGWRLLAERRVGGHPLHFRDGRPRRGGSRRSGRARCRTGLGHAREKHDKGQWKKRPTVHGVSFPSVDASAPQTGAPFLGVTTATTLLSSANQVLAAAVT